MISSQFWGLKNVNGMMPSTNYCSNPTDGVSGGSVVHTESPWTLNITSISLISVGDLIFGLKNRFITILTVFATGSLHEVARLGLEFIGLWPMCTKHINFLMIHNQHVWPSHPIIRWALVPLLSLTPSNMTVNSDFDRACDLEDSRSCSWHFFAPTHHPGPTETRKFKIFINALPRSSNSWFFGIWIFEFRWNR